MGAIDEGLDWALDAEIGSLSEVFEADQAFYMLELVSRREEGPLPLAEATPTIRALLASPDSPYVPVALLDDEFVTMTFAQGIPHHIAFSVPTGNF